LFQAYGNLGTALTAKEQFADAIGAYRQLIALKPDVAQAHFNLGDALTKTNRLDERSRRIAGRLN
jgi:tetratricopeptide (TPR) repeat protein